MPRLLVSDSLHVRGHMLTGGESNPRSGKLLVRSRMKHCRIVVINPVGLSVGVHDNGIGQAAAWTSHHIAVTVETGACARVEVHRFLAAERAHYLGKPPEIDRVAGHGEYQLVVARYSNRDPAVRREHMDGL